MTKLLYAMYPATWRLSAGLFCFQFADAGLWLPAHLTGLWWFAGAVFLVSAVIVATPFRNVQKIARIVMRLLTIAAYLYAFDRSGNTVVLAAAVLLLAYFVSELLGRHPERWINRLFSLVERKSMPDRDAVFWGACQDIADLGKASALYLEGKIGSQPAYQPGESIDAETLPLVPVLAAANRAGFYTTSSQPGHAEEWCQSAYVSGFADPTTTAALRELLAEQPGLNWRIRRTRAFWDTATGGRRIWWGIMARRDVEGFYGEVCNDQAVAALVDGFQIVIEDEIAGRNDILWPLLARFATDRAALMQGEDR